MHKSYASGLEDVLQYLDLVDIAATKGIIPYTADPKDDTARPIDHWLFELSGQQVRRPRLKQRAGRTIEERHLIPSLTSLLGTVHICLKPDIPRRRNSSVNIVRTIVQTIIGIVTDRQMRNCYIDRDNKIVATDNIRALSRVIDENRPCTDLFERLKEVAMNMRVCMFRGFETPDDYFVEPGDFSSQFHLTVIGAGPPRHL